ncbi:MAG TPA: hypothetical protein VFE94_04580 [Candidatus Paceibacterota bacterium]|nr:hypothetical protein [Candidatus Paceibacterota bacterium]
MPKGTKMLVLILDPYDPFTLDLQASALSNPEFGIVQEMHKGSGPGLEEVWDVLQEDGKVAEFLKGQVKPLLQIPEAEMQGITPSQIFFQHADKIVQRLVMSHLTPVERGLLYDVFMGRVG